MNQAMKRNRWIVGSLLAASALVAPGCASSPSRRAAVAASEPTLVTPAEPGTTVVQAPPAHVVTWADRHPLFTKPRQYYDTAGDNKAAKVAAATVVGIPAGIVGELKQIVVGAPPQTPASL
jgi:hypothetical protein